MNVLLPPPILSPSLYLWLSDFLSSSLLKAEARPGRADVLSSLLPLSLFVDRESDSDSLWPFLVQIACFISSLLSLTKIPTTSTTPSRALRLHRLSPQIPLIIIPETSVPSCLSRSLVASKGPDCLCSFSFIKTSWKILAYAWIQMIEW